MDYRVIKEFGFAKPGDVFKNCDNGFILNKSDDTTSLVMAFNESFLNDMIDEGLLEPTNNKESKVDYIEEFINKKLEEYKEDYNNTMRKYENKEIPTCVKVEAETVYYNMSKLLNTIKGMLKDEQIS